MDQSCTSGEPEIIDVECYRRAQSAGQGGGPTILDGFGGRSGPSRNRRFPAPAGMQIHPTKNIARQIILLNIDTHICFAANGQVLLGVSRSTAMQPTRSHLRKHFVRFSPSFKPFVIALQRPMPRHAWEGEDASQAPSADTRRGRQRWLRA